MGDVLEAYRCIGDVQSYRGHTDVWVYPDI